MSTAPLRTFTRDSLQISVYSSNEALGQAAAQLARETINESVQQRGTAIVVLAAANSQLTFLRALRRLDGVPWETTTLFQMDEYLDLPPAHPSRLASLLRRELLDHVPLGAFRSLPSGGPGFEPARHDYETALRTNPIDLCVLGIGENGHLAFNDPPGVLFDDPSWVKAVRIDERSRQQQVSEGHYATLSSVPKDAITLTIPALLSARAILCLVPESRKAEAVQRTLSGPIDPSCPASVLRRTPHAILMLDVASAGDLAAG